MKKKEVIGLIVGYVGALAGCILVILFNNYVLMSLPLLTRMVMSIVTYWLIAVAVIILMAVNKDKLSDIGFSKENIPAQIILGIVSALAMSIVFTLIPHVAGFGSWVDSGKRYNALWQYIYEFTYCIFGVAAVEELVFRGYLYKKAKNIFGKEMSAVIVSSVLFGFLHIFGGNLLQVFLTMIMGVIFCLMRLKIKNYSLLSLIIMHGVYDALITVLANVLPR